MKLYSKYMINVSHVYSNNIINVLHSKFINKRIEISIFCEFEHGNSA